MNRLSEDKYKSWRWAILLGIVYFALWFGFGYLLSLNWFDGIVFLRYFKFINERSDSLSYLAVIFAIQIPIFMLFLQQMVDAKYVKRAVLPRITGFKEIIVCLMIGSTLVLISPRESFVYFPILVLFVASLVAIFKAITLTFHQEQYFRDIQKHLEVIARKSFNKLVLNRKIYNEFSKKLDTIDFIKLLFLSRPITGDMKKIKIIAKHTGYLRFVDLGLMSKAMIREFPELRPGFDEKLPTIKGAQMSEKPEIVLRSYPPNKVKEGRVLAEIVVPTSFKKIRRLRSTILQAFKIKLSYELPIKYFDEVTGSFSRGFSELSSLKELADLQEHIKLFDVFASSFDSQVEQEIVKSNGYGLEQAFMEFRRLNEDDLGKRLYRLYEIYNDALSRSIEYNQHEVADELIHTAYGALVDSSRERFITSVARWDTIFTSALALFVYKNTWNQSLSDNQKLILDKILMRTKEHTELLDYRLGRNREDMDDYTKEASLEDWLRHRIDRLRSFVIATYKDGNKKVFNKLLNILINLQKDSYREKRQSIKTYTQSSLIMIAAYAKNRQDYESDAYIKLYNAIEKWRPKELFDVFMNCINNNYAKAWHIDTYDHKSDGVVRSVPDYNSILKEVWVDMMLKMASFPTDVAYYSDERSLEETTLFTAGIDSESNNELFSIISNVNASEDNKGSLRNLVRGFAKVRYDWESKELIDRPLDQSKVSKFRSLVNDSYRQSSASFNIFTSPKNLLVKMSHKQKGFRRIGVNQVFDKEAFISEWHSGYVTDGMAEDLGRSTAGREDETIFTQLFNNAEEVSTMDGLIKKLRGTKRWIIVANEISTWDLQYQFKQGIRKKSEDSFYIRGIPQKIAIQNTYIDSLPSGVYAVNYASIGRLTRKPHKYEDDQVEVMIRAYSEDKSALNKLLRQAPKWLLEKGDAETQRKFLLRKVNLITDRVFKYEVPAKTEAYFLRISD